MNSSAHIAVSGVTVFDPMTLKEPDNSVGDAGAGVGACLAQPDGTIKLAISNIVSGKIHKLIRFIFGLNSKTPQSSCVLKMRGIILGNQPSHAINNSYRAQRGSGHL